MMKVLAFDTSSKALSVAILDGKNLLADVTVNIKKNHSITLMPAIDFLMTSVDLQPSDLDRIVVAQGPGSYTGLRVAVATAKTLAYTLNIELVGVSSLYALAAAADFDGLVVPIMDARRNNVYAGFYKNGQSVKADQHMSFTAVLEAVKAEAKVMFVGEVDNFRDQIEEALPRLPSSITRLIRRVTSCELYNGSGNTSRLGALFLRLIFSYPPSIIL